MNTTKLYRLITENKRLIMEPVYTELLGMVNEEIAKESEKAAGRKPVTRNAVKKFLGKDDYRPTLKKANIQEINGIKYYGYCDGFKLAWSPVDFGFGEAEEYCTLKWKTLLENYGRMNVTIPITKEMKEELITTLKTKTGRTDRKIFTLHGNGYDRDFNADYLKACIDFTEATEIKINTNQPNGPVIFDGIEDRHALVLPVRR